MRVLGLYLSLTLRTSIVEQFSLHVFGLRKIRSLSHSQEEYIKSSERKYHSLQTGEIVYDYVENEMLT